MGPGKDKEGVWTRIEPIDERGTDTDTASDRSLRARQSDEEIGVAIGGPGDGGSQDGIWQTTTITHEVEKRGQDDRRGKSWLS